MKISTRDAHTLLLLSSLLQVRDSLRQTDHNPPRTTRSAYHLYGKPSNSGENSNGTVHSGGMFSGKEVIPSEVFLFLAFTGIPGNFCIICPQLPVPGYFRAMPKTADSSDESLLFQTVRDMTALLFSRLLLSDFLQHNCSTQDEKDLGLAVGTCVLLLLS